MTTDAAREDLKNGLKKPRYPKNRDYMDVWNKNNTNK